MPILLQLKLVHLKYQHVTPLSQLQGFGYKGVHRKNSQSKHIEYN